MKYKAITLFLLLAWAGSASCQQKKDGEGMNAHKGSVEKGLVKVAVMYPFAEGKRFDLAYYESTHMPMVAGYLGANLVKYTIEKGLSSGIPNAPLPYVAIGSFYVKSLSEYQEAIGPKRDSIRADFPNYTDITPVILVSEVVK